jgi:excisionase family DNA binding protein
MYQSKHERDQRRAAYTVDEVAARNRISRLAVYAEIAAGRLRSYKIGRGRRISADAESDWIRTKEGEAK